MQQKDVSSTVFVSISHKFRLQVAEFQQNTCKKCSPHQHWMQKKSRTPSFSSLQPPIFQNSLVCLLYKTKTS